MGRAISLSFLSLLACGVALTAQGQSRTVSTTNMPKPGVSYIQGPNAPVRRETVSTGSLPVVQPVRAGNTDYSRDDYADNGSRYDDSAYADGYADGYAGGYTGGYPPGYGGNDRGGRSGRGHDGHDGRDRDHDHGGNGRQPGNSLSVGASSQPSTGGAPMNLSPDRRPVRRSGQDGYYNRPQPQPGTGLTHSRDPLPGTGITNSRGPLPGTGATNSRAPQPGTGISNNRGPQPGTGVPMQGGYDRSGR